MRSTSDEYQSAITAPARRVCIRVPVTISDPDARVTGVSGTEQSVLSRPEGLWDGSIDTGGYYASLETNLWTLNGTLYLPAAGAAPSREGWVSEAVCDETAAYSDGQRISISVAGIELLQAVAIYGPNKPRWGIPRDFTVEILQGGTVYYEEQVTGNTEARVQLTGFTVYAPDEIAVTVSAWTVPGRRTRLTEIFPGYREDWTERKIVRATASQRISITGMQLPYGTASLEIDNSDRLFDPRNKTGLFLSLEERQPVPLELGVELADGSLEYIPLGTYYQHGRGWKVRGMTMTWELVDIIGLLASRPFSVPETLPDTLQGWGSAVAGQLGARYSCVVDPSVAHTALSSGGADLTGKTCGEILRWICQATGTVPKAGDGAGVLKIGPLGEAGNACTLDNLNELPELEANDSVSALKFLDGALVVPGNVSAGDGTVTVENPFIRDTAAALSAARHILDGCGGNRILTTGRGDMSWEAGDMITVELEGGTAAAARLLTQEFRYENGVLQRCKSELVQKDGMDTANLHRVVITSDRTWTAPAGVTQLYVILVGGGASGARGEDGTGVTTLFTSEGWNWGTRGANGEDGAGGKVWFGTFAINEGQRFAAVIGSGGAAGSGASVPGTATTFGLHTSEDGQVYTPSFTDIHSGSAYARAGIVSPLPNTGDGGAGGTGGAAGGGYYDSSGNVTQKQAAGKGSRGGNGESGCVIVYY